MPKYRNRPLNYKRISQLALRIGFKLLIALVVLALTWLVLWSLLLRSGIAIVFHRRHNRHEQHLAKSNWQPSRPHSPASNPPAHKQEMRSSSPAKEAALATMTEPRPALRLNEGVGWHVGTRRKQKPNEDSLVILRGTCTRNGQLVSFGLCVIADGMGGHDCGREASNLAIHCMMQSIVPNIFSKISAERLIEMLTDGVQWANQAVYQRNQEYGLDMGTTLTAALVLATTAYIVNVGDSRTYLYREGEGLTQITRDHSLVARLVEKGEIAPDEVYTHPHRNQVYRGLGSEGEVAVDWFAVPVQAGDYLVLCSDGLWEMVRDREIERIVKSCRANPSQASAALVKAALEGGGVDNISVIVVQVAEE